MSNRHKINVIKSAIFALPLLGLAAPAALADQPNELVIQDFIGSINWSNGGENLEVSDRKNARSLDVSTENNITTFDGGVKDLDGDKCESLNGSYDLSFFGKKNKGTFGGYEDLEDYPILTLSLPADTKLTVKNSIIFTQGQPNLRAADLDLTHCGKMNLGNVTEDLQVEGRGAADLTFENAASLTSTMSGSGDIKASDIGFVSAKSHGSGDLEIRQAGDVDIKTAGSGDVEIETITGSAIIETSGSGDYEIGSVAGSLDYRSSGSGDLDLERIGGQGQNRAGLKSSGSGDIYIGGGEIFELFITVSGAADAEINAVVQDAVAKASGAADIYINTVKGSLKKSTSGASDIDVDRRG